MVFFKQLTFQFVTSGIFYIKELTVGNNNIIIDIYKYLGFMYKDNYIIHDLLILLILSGLRNCEYFPHKIIQNYKKYLQMLKDCKAKV